MPTFSLSALRLTKFYYRILLLLLILFHIDDATDVHYLLEFTIVSEDKQRRVGSPVARPKLQWEPEDIQRGSV